MEIINSIYKKDIVKNIFLSSSPLLSFVIYINNKFACYNINCENINIQSPYYYIIIEDDNSLIKDNENVLDNSENKKFKIEYQNQNFKYLEEYNCDLNNAVVITNNNFVDYLLYDFNNNIIIRKFPFMILIQIIKLNFLNKCFVLENSNNILFIDFDVNKNEIKVKSIDKLKIGNN